MKPTSFLITVILALCCSLAQVSAADYTISPGDTLGITVMGEQDLTKKAVVDQQGDVTMPMANQVHVAGLTTAQAAKEITKQLANFIKNPQVSVELAEQAKLRISITGEVKTPGIYPLATGARLMDAVTAAGGYTTTADMSRVTVSHSSQSSQASVVDLTKYLLSGEVSPNISLANGDTIVIPTKDTTALGTVVVGGAVRQPGQYAITKGMTIRDAVMLASGPTELADLSKVALRSQNASEVVIDFSKAATGDPASNLQLKPGDVIYVAARVQLGYYTISGAVTSPGRYEIRDKTTLTEAIAVAGGFRDNAKLDDVRVLRVSDGAGKSFTVNVRDIQNGKHENTQIERDDSVFVNTKKKKPDMMQMLSVAVSLGWLLTR